MIEERDEEMCFLLFKRIAGKIEKEEEQQLEAWRLESELHQQLYDRLLDPAYLEHEYKRRKAINVQRPMAEMQGRINADNGKVFRLHRIKRWAIAASIALLVGISAIQIFLHTSNKTSSIETAKTQLAVSDIKHGETKAVLTMPGGAEVALGANDESNEEAIKHVKSASKMQAETKLNLEVPRGGEFKIVLEDSTEVWLNAESKLIYPEKFSLKERKVTVTGEAYFKVSHDEDRPFFVETDGQLVRVYGTEFNIRSYNEDQQVYTTLVTGSISLTKANDKSGELMLTPGYQALFDKDNAETFVKTVNTDIVTSWRGGRFVFEEQNLGQIMQDLSRWYLFDYQFEEKSLEQIVFKGSIPRYSEFSTVLAILEKSGGLAFSVNGSTVSISQSVDSK
nr:FecR domain-containing protein [uncultured Draconibacterium sp.]